MVKMVDEKGKIKFYEDGDVVLTYDLGKKAFIGVSGREITIRTVKGARYRDILKEISYQAFKDKNTSKEDFFSHAFLYALVENTNLDALNKVVNNEKYYRVGVPVFSNVPFNGKYIKAAEEILQKVFENCSSIGETVTPYYVYLVGNMDWKLNSQLKSTFLRMEYFPEGLEEGSFAHKAAINFFKRQNSIHIPKRELTRFFTWLEKHTKRFREVEFNSYSMGFAEDIIRILDDMNEEKLYTTPGFEYKFDKQILPHEIHLERLKIKNRLLAIESSILQEKAKIYLEKYKDILSYENDKYIIVIPETLQDYIEEGEKQRNCVGDRSGYFEGAILQNKHILFLREKSAPNESVATIQLREDLTVIQFLGKQNRRFDFRSPERGFFEWEYLPTIRKRMGMIGF